VVSDSIRIGGNDLDEAIVRHIKRVASLDIGEPTAERIKMQIGSAYELEEEREMEVRGRDIITGLPKTVTVSSVEVRSALFENVSQIVGRVKTILEHTPPELAADIIERGITLTGGGALLAGVDLLLELETGIPVKIAKDPISCVAIGTGRFLDIIDTLPLGVRSLAG